MISPHSRPASAPPPPARPRSRPLALAFTLLCLGGLAISVELTRVHVGVHTDPAFETACAISDTVNCETVALSPLSVFAGLPVSVWGILGYATMAAIAASALGRQAPRTPWALGLLLLLTAFSAAVSILLAYVSAARIASLCVYCAASQVVSVTLFVLAMAAWRRSRLPLGMLLGSAAALLLRPTGVSVTAAGAAAVGALLWLVPPYWARTVWNELPSGASGTDEAGLHWVGAREPTVTIVEFSDYECPFCRAAHREIRAFVAHHPGVRLVHRHLPLDVACNSGLDRPFHRNACHFAAAAECAGRQGRFWEMNDAIISMQEQVPAEEVDVLALAVRLGLDRGAFQRCVSTGEAGDRILADVREATRRGLRATPTFLVGEQVHEGRIPPPALEALLWGAP